MPSLETILCILSFNLFSGRWAAAAVSLSSQSACEKEGKQLILCNGCASIFWILCFHITSRLQKAYVSPASDEKKRKAITIEMKLKCRLISKHV